MQLHLICVGRLKAGPERELVCHYLSRAEQIGRSLGVSAVDMRELEESRARRSDDRKTEEAKALRTLLATLPGAGAYIACDERGENLTSEGFAQRLDRLREQGMAHLPLIIGGPDGLDPEFSSKAALRLAFGAMTWPHQLARMMAAEQIYRALTLWAGHPYHRP